MKKDFSTSGDATKFKIKIIEDYFEGCFGPLIMQYGKICIIDPFCGPGLYEDGTEGSPIVILKVIKKYLTNEKTREIIFKKNSSITIDINFGDIDEENLSKLKKYIENSEELNFFEKEFGKKDFINYFEGDHISCLQSKKTIIQNSRYPKFIFLDPFNFPVTRDLIDQLVDNRSDLALFVPLNNIHRFKNNTNLPETFQNFINGFSGGKIWEGIQEGIEIIKDNLSKNIKYVRIIELDSGEKSNNKYLIIFFTNNLTAMHIMNKAVFKRDLCGKGFNKGHQEIESKGNLFSHSNLCTISPLVQNVLNTLKDCFCEKDMNNRDIIEFVEKKGIPIENDILKQIEGIINKLLLEDKIDIKKCHTAKKGYYLGFSNYNKEPKIFFSPKLNK